MAQYEGRYYDGESPGNLHEYFENPYVFAFVGLIVVVLLTRAISSRNVDPKGTSLDNGETANTVPSVPYWLPLLGHIPNMAIDADGFVKRLRNDYTHGIFGLNFGATTHNIVYTPGLTTALLNLKSSHADADEVQRRIMTLVFGFPKEEFPKYDEAYVELMACYKYLLTEPSLGEMVSQTAQRTKNHIKDLVTGNESIVDQTPWERTSNLKSRTNSVGEQVVEASLLSLIRDFAAYTASPTIMGTDFLANFPHFFDDIWAVDKGFFGLAAGLPRWVPIPSVTRAHIARKRIIEQCSEFHVAMEKEANGEDPGPKWSSLDDVGELVKARVQIYRKYGWSIRARAAIEHSLMWAANANSDSLVFWMVNRIYADRALLEMIREEMEPYVHAVTPAVGVGGITEAPRLDKLDVDGLCERCPLLKSCYVECLRLDTASWSFKAVKQDFVLQSREKDSQGWLMKKGEYAHAAHDLHNTDPKYFSDPMIWKADRHIKPASDGKKGTADMGSIRPYGGGSSMCKGRAFAFKECMMFTAAIVAMWDIVPAGGDKTWKMPRHKKATGVYATNDVTRVWVKQRVLAKST